MQISPENIKRILMINISHIGDIVLSTPAARALKHYFPHADIDMLASVPQGEAANYNPYISNVIYYNIKDWQGDRAKLLQLITKMRQRNYDIAFAARHGTADPMLAWLSGAFYRVGFDSNCNRKYLTHTVSVSPSRRMHETEYQLAALSLLGIVANDTRIEYTVTAAAEASLAEKLPELHTLNKLVVLLCPFSEDRQKNWTNIGYIAVLQELAKLAECYLLGTSKQAAALNELNTAAGNVAKVLGGTLSLGELGALIKRADLLITVDTGPMHIAQAFATPVIALMGPTDPIEWGPRRPYDIVICKPTRCAPCWHQGNNAGNSCQSNECMRRIDPAIVIQAATEKLAKTRKVDCRLALC